MKKDKKSCLTCGIGKMTHDIRTVVYEYNGVKRYIYNISGWFCNKCGEVEFDKGEGSRYNLEINNVKNSTTE